MQRYRHYGTSSSSAPVEDVHTEEEEEEEVYTEEEVYEGEAEPLIQEEAESVAQETGRIVVQIRFDLVWFGFGSYLAWFGLIRKL